MNLPRPSVALATLAAIVVCLALPAGASDDKLLQNVKGDVSYQGANQAPVPLALKASIPLTDAAYAITGGSSLAALTLPDSSSVMVGSDTKVQLAFFNQTEIATAKFVVYQGRVRFEVRHPQGAKANYTFQTPTGSVAVRGTEGDVLYGADGSLRVNVYELCDPGQAVEVHTKDGKTFTIAAGQSLFAQLVNGVVQTQLGALTQELIDQVSPDFGVPPTWDAAQGRVVSYADNHVAGAVNSATGGYGGSLVPSVGGLFGHKSTPAPSPSAAGSTCK